MSNKITSRKEFNTECKNIIDKMLKDNKEFAKIVDHQSSGWGVKQYLKVIYWYRVMFKKEIDYNNKKIIGFHIMPYQITENDMKKAEMKYENDGINYKYDGSCKEPFNIEIKNNKNYVDYDPDASNFHKNIDYHFQIVLIDKSTIGHLGPGINTSNIVFNKDNINSFINSVKKDKVYFPNINEKFNNKDNDIEEIEKLINETLKELNI